MKPFIIIDRFILNRVERLSHCLQKTFGLRSQKSAQLCYAGMIANILRHVINGSLWWMLLIFPVYLAILAYFMPEQEKRIDSMNASGLSNPRKISTGHMVSRYINMLFTALNFVNPAMMAAMACLTISSYFEACDDLPPGKSRVRKFVDAIKAFGMKPVGVEQ